MGCPQRSKVTLSIAQSAPHIEAGQRVGDSIAKNEKQLSLCTGVWAYANPVDACGL